MHMIFIDGNFCKISTEQNRTIEKEERKKTRKIDTNYQCVNTERMRTFFPSGDHFYQLLSPSCSLKTLFAWLFAYVSDCNKTSMLRFANVSAIELLRTNDNVYIVPMPIVPMPIVPIVVCSCELKITSRHKKSHNYFKQENDYFK